MFPQPKKIWPSVCAVVFGIYTFKNPEKAAELINQAIDAITKFAGALG